MLPSWHCLLPACMPPGFWLVYIGPTSGAIHTNPASMQLCSKKACAASSSPGSPSTGRFPELYQRCRLQRLERVLYVVLIRKRNLAWGILTSRAWLQQSRCFSQFMAWSTVSTAFHLHPIELGSWYFGKTGQVSFSA